MLAGMTAAFAMAAMSAYAQPAASDRLLGERIAIQGGGNAVTPCAVCHGARGEGPTTAGFPPLAGLSAEYLRTQLDRYADGTREGAIMASIAKAMTPAQRAAVAAYYASLSTTIGK